MKRHRRACVNPWLVAAERNSCAAPGAAGHILVMTATDFATDLAIIDFDDAHAAAFHDINAEWIRSMFVLEAHDVHVLTHPREMILNPGGAILLAVSPVHGVVGTCALMKVADGVFELTKMGVSETVRGQKAGELLLRATLDRARTMEMTTLFLLTSSKCEAAIHLYEKHGFVHDADIMQTYGATYDRCNVAMSYAL
jgi:ribosomal protein S18 acetylase RimI-like enzyme